MLCSIVRIHITCFCGLCAEHHLLVGYTVIAFNQVVQKKIDPKTHINALDPLLARLRKRQEIAYVKRLTIVLDEDSEKGFGLVRLACHRNLNHSNFSAA